VSQHLAAGCDAYPAAAASEAGELPHDEPWRRPVRHSCICAALAWCCDGDAVGAAMAFRTYIA
jgi:hypothetical protein